MKNFKLEGKEDLKKGYKILGIIVVVIISFILPIKKEPEQKEKSRENNTASEMYSSTAKSDSTNTPSHTDKHSPKKKLSKEDKEWQELEEYNNKLLQRADQVKILRAKFEKDCFVADYCMNLVLLIQNEMHDPKSFEMVETTYRIEDDHVIVVMKYRGRNAYGAKVLDAIRAKMGFNCEVISIENIR